MSLNDQLSALFHSFDRGAWRWECQGEYAVDTQALQRWRDGQPPDIAKKEPWLRYIRDITTRGKTFERVRMLTEPLTEYLRWMLEQTHTNVDAGEDIRWIDATSANELGMPNYDFYLLDSNRVAIMSFDEARLLAELEVIDDPDIVDRHRAFRDAVWPRAISHADYQSLRST